MKSQEEATKVSAKKPYAPPRVICYGAVRDLTAGGTGTANEGSATEPRHRRP